MLMLQLVGGDPDKDIAVLQLECEQSKIEEFKPISLGQSSNLLVGQKVYAIGNPFGLDHTLTQGIVSGVGRELNTPGMLESIPCQKDSHSYQALCILPEGLLLTSSASYSARHLVTCVRPSF